MFDFFEAGRRCGQHLFFAAEKETIVMKTLSLQLTFPITQVKEPIIYHLVSDYGLTPNVRRARIEAPAGGTMQLDLTGDDDDLENGQAFLRGLGIAVDSVEAAG